MKKKIIGIFVGAMLFATTFAIAKNVETMDLNQGPYGEIPTSFDDDVPIWKVGYKWIYNIEFSYIVDEEDYMHMSLQISLNNFDINVVDCTGDSYRTEFDDNVNGDFSIQVEGSPTVTGNFKNTVLDGYAIFEKTNLSVKEVYAHLEGRLSLSGLIPIPFDCEVTLNFEPSYSSLDFPLYVGKNWEIPDFTMSIVGSISLPGIASIIPGIPDEIEIDNEMFILGGDAECVGMESITVSADTYNAYNISVDGSTSYYYAPAAGFIIKIAQPLEEYDIVFELKSTNYIEPGAPNKPAKPSGTTSGKTGEEYTYSTSTTDPDGDQVWYKWDWGDEISGWDEPYDSGDTVTVSHIWDEKGSYVIKVKAKDVHGKESPWSDPLPITMPKNKAINTLFLQFLEQHLRMFPILRQLLGL